MVSVSRGRVAARLVHPLVLPLLVLIVRTTSPAEAADGFPADDATDAARGSALAAADGPQVDLGSLTRKGARYLARVEGGGEAELTLVPELQEAADELLRAHRIAYGAAVVVSVPDGRVLALAGRSERDAALGPAELALRPWAPSASVFKVVAASALVAHGGLGASTRVCYHGGVSAVLPDNLVDLPRVDRRCDTLAYGIGKSQNAIIAKLTVRHLTPEALSDVAQRFGFGTELPFEAPLEPSTVDIPEDRLEFARAAAGFYHSALSPLHGALLAATIANRGEMPAARLVARAVDADGRALTAPVRSARRVLAAEHAREVGRMMELTTRAGTAHGGFYDRRGRPLLPVAVAGKTGTLSFRPRSDAPEPPSGALAQGEWLGYSWFIGYAPAERPRFAFAVLLGNQGTRYVRASSLARTLVAQQLAVEAPGAARRPSPAALLSSAREGLRRATGLKPIARGRNGRRTGAI